MDDFEVLPHDESKFDHDGSDDIWGFLSDILQRTPRNKTSFEDLWSPDASQQKRQKITQQNSSTVKDDNIRLLDSIHDPTLRKLLSTLASDEPLPDPQRIIQQINTNFLLSPAKPPVSPYANQSNRHISTEDAGIALKNLSRTADPVVLHPLTPASCRHAATDPSSPLTSVAMAFFAEDQAEHSDQQSPSDHTENLSQDDYYDTPITLPPISEAPRVPVYHSEHNYYPPQPVVAPLPSVSILCSQVGNVLPYQFPLDKQEVVSVASNDETKLEVTESPATANETKVLRIVTAPPHSSENVINIGDACAAFIAHCDSLKLQHNGADVVVECDYLCHLLQIKRRRVVDLMQILQVLRLVSNLRGKPVKYMYHGHKYIKSALALIQRDGFINFPELAKKFTNVPDLMEEKQLELRVFATPTSIKRFAQGRDDSYPLPQAVEDYLQLFLLGNQRMAMQDTLKVLRTATVHRHRAHLKQLREATKAQSYSRRLYDITNALCALKILRKQVGPGASSLRQNYYVWIYDEPEGILDHYKHLCANQDLVEIIHGDTISRI